MARTDTRIQFIQTVLLGGIAFVVDFACLWICHGLLKIEVVTANSIGCLAGIIVSYLGSRYLIFPLTGKPVALEITAFACVFITGLALSNLLIWLGVKVLILDYRIAKILSLAPVTLWNFFLRKHFVFRSGTRSDQGSYPDEARTC